MRFISIVLGLFLTFRLNVLEKLNPYYRARMNMLMYYDHDLTLFDFLFGL